MPFDWSQPDCENLSIGLVYTIEGSIERQKNDEPERDRRDILGEGVRGCI